MTPEEINKKYGYGKKKESFPSKTCPMCFTQNNINNNFCINCKYDFFDIQAEETEISKPKCPTCSSTNITKISTTSKVAGAVAFGLFSKTARSQFKCNNCGYKW